MEALEMKLADSRSELIKLTAEKNESEKKLKNALSENKFLQKSLNETKVFWEKQISQYKNEKSVNDYKAKKKKIIFLAKEKV